VHLLKVELTQLLTPHIPKVNTKYIGHYSQLYFVLHTYSIMRTVLLEIYCIHLLLKTSNVLFLSTMYCFKPTVGNSFFLFLLLSCTMHCFYYYDDPHAKCTVLLTGTQVPHSSSTTITVDLTVRQLQPPMYSWLYSDH
jgi:hypothetical protein